MVIAASLLQAAALAQDDLALVEPVLVEPVLALELPFTLALAGVLFRRRLHVRERTSVALLTAGVALLLRSLSPAGGHPAGVALYEWGIALSANLTVVGLLVGRARRSASAGRAALLGLSSPAPPAGTLRPRSATWTYPSRRSGTATSASGGVGMLERTGTGRERC